MPIAEFLAQWAINGNPQATVLDPTCGDGVFLVAGGEELRNLGAPAEAVARQVVGVDLHEASLREARDNLGRSGLGARTIVSDFFDLASPDTMFSDVPAFDAVIGNPPFVRYQLHIGDTRRRSVEAALREGVRLSGLASSWAASLVHAGAFLAPEGRLGMVLPAELLTVGYAEPIRRWLRQRFEAVRIVVVESLQFQDALEKVVLLLANGTGGCEGFSLYHVSDLDELPRLGFSESTVWPAEAGKWTELLLRAPQRRLFRSVMESAFVPLSDYGTVSLGTVTGANDFFAIDDATRDQFSLDERDLARIHPPGTKDLRGLAFTARDWESLRAAGERVWLLYPRAGTPGADLGRYLALGESRGIHLTYKTRIRTPWWRPPLVPAPDLYFTYMSHHYPRIVGNRARAFFLNSMHGVRLLGDPPPATSEALPMLTLNSLTLLGAELFGRSYGGGVLKMEPREAASLPVLRPETLLAAWNLLRANRRRLDAQLRRGLWTSVAAHIDQVVFTEVLRLPPRELDLLREAANGLRARRTSRDNNSQ